MPPAVIVRCAGRRCGARLGPNSTGPWCHRCRRARRCLVCDTITAEPCKGRCQACRKVTGLSGRAHQRGGSGEWLNPPGHEERIAVYCERAAKDEPLFSPGGTPVNIRLICRDRHGTVLGERHCCVAGPCTLQWAMQRLADVYPAAHVVTAATERASVSWLSGTLADTAGLFEHLLYYEARVLVACPWCGRGHDARGGSYCHNCGHNAVAPRSQCECAVCTAGPQPPADHHAALAAWARGKEK